MTARSLKIETVKIDAVLPYAQNARLHSEAQIDQIAESISEVGFVNPCLIDGDGVLIAGHGRILAAKKLGHRTVPVIRLGYLTDEQAKILRIKDNAIPLQSSWDAAMLATEIGSLKTAGYDITKLGFPEMQLRGWGIAVGTESDEDAEEVPDAPKHVIVRKGDIWKLGGHRILCGDSTSKKDVAALLGDDKPNLMVTDPPYGVAYDANWRNERVRSDGAPSDGRAIGKVRNDDESDWRKAWTLFPGSVAYCWSADLRSSSAVQSLEACEFVIRAQIIWAKSRFAIGRGDYHFQHEPCWYAVRKNSKSHWSGARNQSTLWTINHIKSETGHSTQKPIECMKRPIENNSRKGDFVYEPFSGSGTTIIAGEMTGRKVLAIEIDPSYVQIAIERWMKWTGKQAMLDGKTFDQVARARRKGKAITDEASDPRKPVSRRDTGSDAGASQLRDKGNARRTPARRVPARVAPVVARDTE